MNKELEPAPLPSGHRTRPRIRVQALGSQDAHQGFDVLLHDLFALAGLGTGRPRGQRIELDGGSARLPDKHLDDAGRELGVRHEHVAPLRIAHGPCKARNVGRRRRGVRLRLQDEGDFETRVVEQPAPRLQAEEGAGRGAQAEKH